MRAVNLIPTEERSGASAGAGRSQGGAYGVLGLIAGLAVLALLFGIAHHQASSRRAQLASISAQTARAQQAASQLTPYTSFMALREQRRKAVAQLVESRFDWAHAFHELGRVLPIGASISSLEGTVGSSSGSSTGASPSSTTAAAPATSTTAAGGTAVASSTPPGSVPTVTIGGCAVSQSEVALTLLRLRLIDGVSSVSLKSSTKAPSSGASRASEGACGSGKPTFSAQITFDPLPSATGATAS
ncbi:MAG TPA: hypothetical protein VK605_08495, partial [Solirubrobacteraceae bacterium]|nr:hypothetical protein [Solirubrobacteraceae bacterium]